MSDTRPGAGTEGIRSIMRRALSLYRARFALYLALVALPVVPVGVAIIALAAAAPDPAGSANQIAALDAVAEFLLVTPICQAAVAIAVVAQLDGRTPAFRETLRIVLPRWSVLVGTVILSALAIVAGLVALVIPGLVMAIWFQFVGQVVILEGTTYLAALRRCRELVRGVWWRTFGYLLVIGVTGAVASVVITTLISGGVRPQDASDRSRLVVPLIANVPASLLILPFSTIAVTLIYLQLRARERSAAT